MQLEGALRLAEHDSITSPGNLEYIGWAARKEQTALKAPGQPTGLAIVFQGPGTIGLKWHRPTGKGRISHYRLERSCRPKGLVPEPWKLAETCYHPHIKLTDQPRDLELQYRVIASNQAGNSTPSNIASAVL